MHYGTVRQMATVGVAGGKQLGENTFIHLR